MPRLELNKITVFQQNRNNLVKFVSLMFLVLVAWLIVVKIVSIYFNYNNSLIGHDPYQFYEGTKEITFSGASKLQYLPNGNTGLDLFMWVHLFPPYLYAFFDAIWGIEVQDLYIFSCMEFILLIIALFWIISIYAHKIYTFIFIGVIIFDPLFNYVFIDAYIWRWSLIFALLSLICFFILVKIKKYDNLLSFLTGMFAVMSPFSFISIGVPAFLGVAFAFFIEHIYFNKGLNVKNRLIWFLLGVSTPVIIFIIYIIYALGKENLYNLIFLITKYSEFVSNKPDSTKFLIKIVYFFSTILSPTYGLSLLPAGIAATLLNYHNRNHLNDSERFLNRITLFFTLSWIICAMPMSKHFFAARMIWILPFFVPQLFIAIKYKNSKPFVFCLLVAFVFITLAIQGIYHMFGTPYAPYGHGVAAAVVVFITVIFFIIYKFLSKYCNIKIEKWTNIIIALAVIILITPTVKSFADKTSSIICQKKLFFREEPFAQTFIKEAKKVTYKEVVSGESVLTNFPYRSLFQPGVRRQHICFYHGLYSGATLKPSEKVLLFGINPYEDIYPNYENVKTGSNIYYRGFTYHIGRRIELIREYYLLIGTPVKYDEAEDIVYPKDYIKKEKINAYLDWRLNKGLPLN
tara:strand:+ start:811 stop:2700 length:1890 start_codon:yes stop_codon:yes gene_type:complete